MMIFTILVRNFLNDVELYFSISCNGEDEGGSCGNAHL